MSFPSPQFDVTNIARQVTGRNLMPRFMSNTLYMTIPSISTVCLGFHVLACKFSISSWDTFFTRFSTYVLNWPHVTLDLIKSWQILSTYKGLPMVRKFGVLTIFSCWNILFDGFSDFLLWWPQMTLTHLKKIHQLSTYMHKPSPSNRFLA